eukprot:7383441-Prymnesium_polylepis.1
MCDDPTDVPMCDERPGALESGSDKQPARDVSAKVRSDPREARSAPRPIVTVSYVLRQPTRRKPRWTAK